MDTPAGADEVSKFARACRRLHIRAAACRGSNCVALSEIKKDSNNLYQPFCQTLNFIYKNWSKVVKLYILHSVLPTAYPPWYTDLATALSYFACPCDVNARDMPYVPQTLALALDPKRVHSLRAVEIDTKAFTVATGGTVFGLVQDVLQNNAKARHSLSAALYETRAARQKLLSTAGAAGPQIRALLRADVQKPVGDSGWSPVLAALIPGLLAQSTPRLRSPSFFGVPLFCRRVCVLGCSLQGPAAPKEQRGLQGSTNSCYIRALMQCLSCCFNTRVIPPEGAACTIKNCIACAILSLSNLVQGNAQEVLVEDGELFKRLEKAASHVQQPDDPQQALLFIWESLKEQLEDNKSANPHAQVKKAKELWFGGRIVYMCQGCDDIEPKVVHTWPALDKADMDCTHLNTCCKPGAELADILTQLTSTEQLGFKADGSTLRHCDYTKGVKCRGFITDGSGFLFSAYENPRFAMIWFTVEYGVKRLNPPLREEFRATYTYDAEDWVTTRNVDFRVVAMIRHTGSSKNGHYTTLRRGAAGRWYHANNTVVTTLQNFAHALRIATGPNSWVRMVLLENVGPKPGPKPPPPKKR